MTNIKNFTNSRFKYDFTDENDENDESELFQSAPVHKKEADILTIEKDLIDNNINNEDELDKSLNSINNNFISEINESTTDTNNFFSKTDENNIFEVAEIQSPTNKIINFNDDILKNQDGKIENIQSDFDKNNDNDSKFNDNDTFSNFFQPQFNNTDENTNFKLNKPNYNNFILPKTTIDFKKEIKEKLNDMENLSNNFEQQIKNNNIEKDKNSLDDDDLYNNDETAKNEFLNNDNTNINESKSNEPETLFKNIDDFLEENSKQQKNLFNITQCSYLNTKSLGLSKNFDIYFAKLFFDPDKLDKTGSQIYLIVSSFVESLLVIIYQINLSESSEEIQEFFIKLRFFISNFLYINFNLKLRDYMKENGVFANDSLLSKIMITLCLQPAAKLAYQQFGIFKTFFGVKKNTSNIIDNPLLNKNENIAKKIDNNIIIDDQQYQQQSSSTANSFLNVKSSAKTKIPLNFTDPYSNNKRPRLY